MAGPRMMAIWKHVGALGPTLADLHKPAGQTLLMTGSRIATHST